MEASSFDFAPDSRIARVSERVWQPVQQRGAGRGTANRQEFTAARALRPVRGTYFRHSLYRSEGAQPAHLDVPLASLRDADQGDPCGSASVAEWAVYFGTYAGKSSEVGPVAGTRWRSG